MMLSKAPIIGDGKSSVPNSLEAFLLDFSDSTIHTMFPPIQRKEPQSSEGTNRMVSSTPSLPDSRVDHEEEVESLRSEISRLQYSLNVEKTRSGKQKVVSGSQFRIPQQQSIPCVQVF